MRAARQFACCSRAGPPFVAARDDAQVRTRCRRNDPVRVLLGGVSLSSGLSSVRQVTHARHTRGTSKGKDAHPAMAVTKTTLTARAAPCLPQRKAHATALVGPTTLGGVLHRTATLTARGTQVTTRDQRHGGTGGQECRRSLPPMPGGRSDPRWENRGLSSPEPGRAASCRPVPARAGCETLGAGQCLS